MSALDYAQHGSRRWRIAAAKQWVWEYRSCYPRRILRGYAVDIDQILADIPHLDRYERVRRYRE